MCIRDSFRSGKRHGWTLAQVGGNSKCAAPYRREVIHPMRSLSERLHRIHDGLRRHTEGFHHFSSGCANAEAIDTNDLSIEADEAIPVSYTHLRAHETPEHLVCR